ncbi:hypothetical protein BCR34DRAFT_590592 [Clohesyomyces aquaticus]|uniref:Pentatricopeptide repeat domain-containing protein n=1 Tax=Clohesyomyces aquaticus TaxID=1231657 RepID=A0A1Y1Z8B7_9PLEO|nr:hypothetical protein BCR34DRAFT_590592 [Clohesyomyces aquaticus]
MRLAARCALDSECVDEGVVFGVVWAEVCDSAKSMLAAVVAFWNYLPIELCYARAGSNSSRILHRNTSPQLTIQRLRNPNLARPRPTTKHASIVMQGIWSRTVRNPGTCRCVSCLSNTVALARRPGAARLRGPWVFGTPTSTFFYTAIFAAGLAIDGKAKRDRSEQWDVAFNLLRAEMSKKPARPPPLEELDPAVDSIVSGRHEEARDESIGVAGYMPPEEVWPNGVDWDFMFRTTGMELIEDPELLQRQFQIDFQTISEELWRILPFDSRAPGTQALEWPVNTGPEFIRHNLPPQSLWSYDHVREKSLRNRQTWKKLAIQELAVGVLIHRLLWQARAHRLSEDVRRTLPRTIFDIASFNRDKHLNVQGEMMDLINKLHGLPGELSVEEIQEAKSYKILPGMPQFYQDADGDFYYICQQMNAAVRRLFLDLESNNAGQMPVMITKVCHNLLVSTSAPDVQTFNILLAGLKRCGTPEMVDSVIRALYHCKIRPNEITTAAVLDHYIQTDRPEAFSEFVGYMRGIGGALMLARPDITINEASQGRLVRVSDRVIYQKVFPTPLVFNTLMLGALKFAGLGRALEIYYEMKEDGWGLDVPSLNHFLTDCVHRADLHTGLYVWEEINSLKQKAKKEHMTEAYSTMLSLCSVTGNTAAFNQVLMDLARRGFDRKRILNAAMKTTQKLRGTQDVAAPPQTADNVLFAISAYMDDTGSPQDERVQDERVQENQTDASKDEIPPVEDSEAAWASWLQHELGGPPKGGQCSVKPQ